MLRSLRQSQEKTTSVRREQLKLTSIRRALLKTETLLGKLTGYQISFLFVAVEFAQRNCDLQNNVVFFFYRKMILKDTDLRLSPAESIEEYLKVHKLVSEYRERQRSKEPQDNAKQDLTFLRDEDRGELEVRNTTMLDAGPVVLCSLPYSCRSKHFEG